MKAMKALEFITRNWPRRLALVVVAVLAGMLVAGCHEGRGIGYYQPVYVNEHPRPVVVVEHRRPLPPPVIAFDRQDDRHRTIDRGRPDDRRQRDDHRDRHARPR